MTAIVQIKPDGRYRHLYGLPRYRGNAGIRVMLRRATYGGRKGRRATQRIARGEFR